MTDKLLTRSDVHYQYGVSLEAIDNARRLGDLEVFQPSRPDGTLMRRYYFRQSAVDAWLSRPA